MTTYAAISNAVFDVGKPARALDMRQLRDNMLAVLENDASVPAEAQLRPLLGTLTTTSGSTQTLSSLVLTPFRFVRCTFLNLSANATANVLIGGVAVAVGAAASDTISGFIDFDLANGVWAATSNNRAFGGSGGITSAATSISASVSAGSFDGGSVRIYGVK